MTSSRSTTQSYSKEYSDFSEYEDESSEESNEEECSKSEPYDLPSEVEYSDFSDYSSSSEENDENEDVFVILHIPLEKDVDGEVSKKKVSCCIKFPNKKQLNRARESLFQIEEIEYWIEDTYGNWYLSHDDDIIEICDNKKKNKVDIDLTN